MKKFFEEFKKFITRGNVVDMAVGVTVGSAFTAIVNGLSNNILKPIINFFLTLILGKDSLSEVYTFLKKVYVDVEVEGVTVSQVDLTQSIYIDWGAFINAVINFFIIAFVLFSIVKIVNGFREQQDKLSKLIEGGKLTKAEKTEMKAAGLDYKDKTVIDAFRAEKIREAEAAAEAEKAAAEEAARAEAEKAAYVAGADDRQEALLREIVELLKKNG